MVLFLINETLVLHHIYARWVFKTSLINNVDVPLGLTRLRVRIREIMVTRFNGNIRFSALCFGYTVVWVPIIYEST